MHCNIMTRRGREGDHKNFCSKNTQPHWVLARLIHTDEYLIFRCLSDVGAERLMGEAKRFHSLPIIVIFALYRKQTKV